MHKIATCCYCGTRAALVLRGEGRHELSCAACGAPLRQMKAIARPRAAPAPKPRATAAPQPSRRPVRRRKPRKPFLRKFIEEVWDEVEDIFD